MGEKARKTEKVGEKARKTEKDQVSQNSEWCIKILYSVNNRYTHLI